jgi:hypothetical protein
MKKTECHFSTGICETLTCCRDGKFDAYGYPINKCKQYPCLKMQRMLLEQKLRDLKQKRDEISWLIAEVEKDLVVAKEAEMREKKDD